jgi:hypothetical protein
VTPTDPAAYGQLLFNATSYWADNTGWWPGKWATVAVLRAAAANPAYHQAVAQHAAVLAADPPVPPTPPAPPTLADLVRTAFEVVLLIYGPTLPFGGYWVRAARDFVLTYLAQFLAPKGLVYQGVR